MRNMLLGLTACVAIALCAASPTNAHSLCRSITAGGIPVDQFGRPCATGQTVGAGAHLFVGPPVIVVPQTLQDRRIPQPQPLPRSGFTTGSIGPFTTGPLGPFTTTPLVPAPLPGRGR
jgi:hypothetical protein